ncbi:MAG TPA: ATP-binding protein [Firmicutes bacterium]|nr:ATP-binding protein [Candidatus Fermentithermobacillaceae bacterium]
MSGSSFELFQRDRIVGVFRSFTEGGLEFHADVVLPYRSDFQRTPMHGQFMIVQLETPDEAVLGRITSFSAEGRLAYGSGEEFNIRAVRENRPVPEDLREQYLKYKVNIRVLGVIRKSGDRLVFVPSQRRLPHVGSPVAFLPDPVLQWVGGHYNEGVPLGFFALGEYIYAGGSPLLKVEEWMRVISPEVLVKFDVASLVSRRTFVFARAGFGKSNLNKLLFSSLYRQTPYAEKRGGKKVPVGTVLFDPEGEYFWPDDKGRPGLCDDPDLRDQIVVFTPRQPPSGFYGSFVVGDVKLDIRRLKPSDVISIAISLEKQDQQNVRKLRGLSQDKWSKLVDLIDRYGNEAPIDEIRSILNLHEDRQDVEALAARGNMTTIVRMLHSRTSQLMDLLIQALQDGKLCIVDISQMRGTQALIFTGLVLRRIFDRNQEEFTSAEPRTIPVIAVIEEAQAVLVEGKTGAEPYITWVKEGRKYDLGAVLITQQPGSIPTEILSQGDNWFVFHLLSSADLQNVRRANAHFSEDLLSSLLNEPIPGQGVFWSSVSGKPYPVPIRVLSFEQKCSPADPHYEKAAIDTYASRLRERFRKQLMEAETALGAGLGTGAQVDGSQSVASYPVHPGQTFISRDSTDQEPVDAIEVYKRRAFGRVKQDADFMRKLRTTGVAWGSLKVKIKNALPPTLDDVDQFAYNLVREFLNDELGPEGEGWESFKNERNTTYVRAKQH